MTQSILAAIRCFVRLGFVVAIGLIAFVESDGRGAELLRERVSFNADWRFIKGDPVEASNRLNYAEIRDFVVQTGNTFAKDSSPRPRPKGEPGADVPYAQAAFDDSAWRNLNLPHDWGIEGPFKQEYPGNTGKLPYWGVGWYRKHFDVPASDSGRRILLDVDGAMSYATVWLNGKFVGGWPYGYASWQVDLTPFVKFGAVNVLAIRLDNPADSSRWYPGGGIYRNVWLEKTSPVHVAQWGTYVTTPEVSKESATINVQVQIQNDSGVATQVNATTALFELKSDGTKSQNAIAVLSTSGVEVGPGKVQNSTAAFSIAKPKLWSVSAPNRYVAVTRLEERGKTVDQFETPFGIRTIKFDAEKGFSLNGEHLKIQGVCNHHDLGALGAALNIRALERQLEILRDMGCNAIRTSHNPPAPELLDLCDRMGFLVMDEAFDCWVRGKRPNDYSLLFPDWHEKDWRAQIRRDRNHPSIILWSIGNEVHEQAGAAGQDIARDLARIAHEEDATRPVTAACNNGNAGYNGFQKTVDVFGYNYKPREYAKVQTANPGLLVIGTETSSCISSRGEYFFPVTNNKNEGRADFQMSSYDLYSPGWGCPPDVEFEAQDKYPFVAGEFVWTGFDYLGEPTPYNADTSTLLNFSDPEERARLERELGQLGKIRVPSRSSYFGIVDLAGFKKDRFYLYQSHWRPDFPMAHILPHWNWPERVGQVTPVHVYSSGDEAELFLNGKSLGRKKRNPSEYRFRWDNVIYEPGTLEVIAYKNGKRWATDVIKTTGPASQIVLEPDRIMIAADGQDICFVTARVADKNGLTVPRSNNEIQFEVSGSGEIVATDNGNPTSFEPFQSPIRHAFNGLALAIVRAKPGTTGRIELKAQSQSLKGDSEIIRTR